MTCFAKDYTISEISGMPKKGKMRVRAKTKAVARAKDKNMQMALQSSEAGRESHERIAGQAK